MNKRKLEIIPAKVYVIEHIKKKYACKKCEETIKTAKMPTLPIPRSIASAGLLSHVLVSKFQDHLPLYRQEKILKRIGVDIPRATLCLWVLKCAELLKPLLKLLHDYIISYHVAYADETMVQVLKEPNIGVQSKKYMWYLQVVRRINLHFIISIILHVVMMFVRIFLRILKAIYIVMDLLLMTR